MRREAYAQFLALERDHWWFRGRRAVYLALLDRFLARRGHYADPRAPAARPRRVLDLGCGPGGFLPGLAERCETVVACDVDLESLRGIAGRQDLARPVLRLCSPAAPLPFRDGAFDLLCLFDVLEHLDDDAGALREARRVLAPGGVLLLSVPAYPWLFANNDRVAMHRRRYTRRTLAAAVEGAGFAILRNTHANVLLAPAIVPVALALKALETKPGAEVSDPCERTNLSWPLPRWAHGALWRVFAAETCFTGRWDAPFGHSIALLAEKTGP